MYIEIPEQVFEQMDSDERVVGYMMTLFKGILVFTKKGCSSREGCVNFLYNSENNFKKQDVVSIDPSDLERYEKHFISAFLWN